MCRGTNVAVRMLYVMLFTCVWIEAAWSQPGEKPPFYSISAIACVPSSQTIDDDLHLTQGGNVRFEDDKTGVITMFCPLTVDLRPSEILVMRALVRDEDGRQENTSISVTLRQVDRENGLVSNNSGREHIQSNINCQDHGEWQECSTGLNGLDFGNFYYFFQVTLTRSSPEENISFGGIFLVYVIG